MNKILLSEILNTPLNSFDINQDNGFYEVKFTTEHGHEVEVTLARNNQITFTVDGNTSRVENEDYLETLSKVQDAVIRLVDKAGLDSFWMIADTEAEVPFNDLDSDEEYEKYMLDLKNPDFDYTRYGDINTRITFYDKWFKKMADKMGFSIKTSFFDEDGYLYKKYEFRRK